MEPRAALVEARRDISFALSRIRRHGLQGALGSTIAGGHARLS